MSSLQGSSEDEQEISNPVTKNKKPTPMNVPISIATCGGEGGIRTHGALANTAVFKTAALNHSTTSPWSLKKGQPMAVTPL